jgi:putative DNA-invertase from lambdoid prophage Rac
MTFDGATKDPMQQAVRDALIGFMAALSQAQAEANKEAQKAGIAPVRATPNPLKPKTYLGLYAHLCIKAVMYSSQL